MAQIYPESIPDDVRKYLTEERMITPYISKKFGLQWLKKYLGHPWIYIPIHDPKGKNVGGKLRRPPGSEAEQKTRFLKDTKTSLYGSHLVFQESNLKSVVICEGEFDALLLLSHKIPAVTSTGGAGTFYADWLELFPESIEEIILCFDLDKAGHAGAQKVSQLIAKRKPDVRMSIIRLPEELGEGGDVTDLARSCKEKGTDFRETFFSLKENIPPGWTQTPKGYVDPHNLPVSTLEDVLVTTRSIGIVHDYIAETVLATYISKEIEKRNPLWLMLVGNPSSNKTQLVSLLRWCKDVCFLDTITPNAFVSGAAPDGENEPQDLLDQLKGQCFIIKDYTPFFGRSEETVKQLLSDLVAIYDGEYAKHSPTRGTVRYQASFSHIGCVTPHGLVGKQSYMNMVGPRFLMLRVPELTEDERKTCVDMSWEDDFGSRAQKAQETAMGLVIPICKSLKEKGLFLQPVEPSVRAEINQLAEFVRRSRGMTIPNSYKFKNDEGQEITGHEIADKQIEEPFRALGQLRALCRSLAVLRGKESVTIEEVQTARLVAFSSMPTNRADCFSVFSKVERATAKEAADILGKNYKTAQRHMNELCALGILHKEQDSLPTQVEANFDDEEVLVSGKNAWVYTVHPRFASLVSAIFKTDYPL